MSAITRYEQNKNELSCVISDHADMLKRLPADSQSRFVDNFIELASNDFLMSKIKDKSLLLKLAIDLSGVGININPFSKHVSIIPFEIKKGSGYFAPQAITHIKGKQEEYHRVGFFLSVSKVWDVDGSAKREDEMDYKELARIDETDKNFREKHFVGWVISITDLKGELPKQEKFVSYKYAKSAAKNKQMPIEFELEGLLHSAVRHAEKYFVIPDSRRPKIIDVIEEANSKIINEVDKDTHVVETTTIPTAPPKKEEPRYKVIGNRIMEKVGGDVAAFKAFIIEALDWPADTELKGKFMEKLTDDDLDALEGALAV